MILETRHGRNHSIDGLLGGIPILVRIESLDPFVAVEEVVRREGTFRLGGGGGGHWLRRWEAHATTATAGRVKLLATKI